MWVSMTLCHDVRWKMSVSSSASHCPGMLEHISFLFLILSCCCRAGPCCGHQENPYDFAFSLIDAIAVFPVLPVPISGKPINPDIMLFPCKRQFVKICLGAAVTISMGFISRLFTVCAHVYAVLLSHHNLKLDCPLDFSVTCNVSCAGPRAASLTQVDFYSYFLFLRMERKICRHYINLGLEICFRREKGMELLVQSCWE